MSARLVQVGPSPADVLLRTRHNWPAAATAATFAILHIAVAAAYVNHYPLAFGVAATLGVMFALVAVAMLFSVRELEINVSYRCIRVRRRLLGMEHVRYIPFTQVQAVRLTQYDQYGYHRSRIELLLASETLRCPTTDAPRQQALLMAMAISTRLIKVWQSTTSTAPQDRIQRLFGSEQEHNNP